jgi:oleate hydratase
MHEFPRINTLAGVDRTPYNQYDSIIAPIVAYLTAKGVDFRYNTRVLDVNFIEGIPLTASEIHMTQNGTPMTVNMDPDDVVFVTLGSMTAGTAIGTNTEPPPTVAPEAAQDGSWTLWNKLAAKDESSFGNPTNFSQRVPESTWESFTVTLRDPQRTFLKRLTAFSHNEPGTGALVTFKDSPWLMSIVFPHQPHFIHQPEDVQVFWGYGLIPNREGSIVKKPMKDCSGTEILTELLSLLAFPEAETATILSTSITRPCLMPYITAQFLTREPYECSEYKNFSLLNQHTKKVAKHGDRPLVIPERSTNIALLGQFVEIPDDVVFTVEYSVRGAQMAVYQLFGVEKSVKPPVLGERSMVMLAEIGQKLLS